MYERERERPTVFFEQPSIHTVNDYVYSRWQWHASSRYRSSGRPFWSHSSIRAEVTSHSYFLLQWRFFAMAKVEANSSWGALRSWGGVGAVPTCSTEDSFFAKLESSCCKLHSAADTRGLDPYNTIRSSCSGSYRCLWSIHRQCSAIWGLLQYRVPTCMDALYRHFLHTM